MSRRSAGAALLADESLGGDGTPAVAAFTPEPFALALGMSPSPGPSSSPTPSTCATASRSCGNGCRRLEVPAWQARRVARQTHRLPKAAAIWVDEQLADRGTCGPVIVDRLVAQAIATYDPEDTRRPGGRGPAGWDVTLTHPDPTDFLGTSHLDATGDTLVLEEFYDHVCGIAHQLYLDGDTSPLGVRKIKALGILTGQPTTTGNAKVKVYARVEARDLEPGALAVGQVEKLGTATLTKIRDWVGHHQVVIQPVLNMARRDAVDSHDPPPGCATSSTSETNTASSPDATSTPDPATSTTPPPTTSTDHPAKPDPTTSPPCAEDTTAPRPPAAGGTSARPTATTTGTAPTARRTRTTGHRAVSGQDVDGSRHDHDGDHQRDGRLDEHHHLGPARDGQRVGGAEGG